MGEFDLENDIRMATPDDFQNLFKVCHDLWRENGQHEFSENKARHFIWRGCNRDNAFIFVIGPVNDIRAVLYLEVQQVYYSDECQLGEAFLYVREDCRRINYAKRLIVHAKRCSEETQLDLVMGIISDHRLAAKKRLYDREFTDGGNGTFYIHKPKSRGERQGFNVGASTKITVAGG